MADELSSRAATWAKVRSTGFLVGFLVLVVVVLAQATSGGVGQVELVITGLVLVVGLVVIWRPR
jgi:hypothetical protein